MRNLMRLLLLIALASNLAAELVTITGTANYADSSPGSGSLVITYDQFINEQGDVIGGSIRTPIGANGAVSVQLWSNASSYTVRYAFDVRDQQRTRYWNVPQGQGTSLTIPDVEVPTPTNLTRYPVGQIDTTGANASDVILSPGGGGTAYWGAQSGGGQIPTSSIDIPLVTGAQETLEEFQTQYESAGTLKEGYVTDGGAGTINVTSGTGLIRTASNETGALRSFEWPITNGLTPTDNTMSYVVARYNAGTPDVVVQTGAANGHDEIMLGWVYREGTSVSIGNRPWRMGGIDRRLLDWMDAVGLIRDPRIGGLVVYNSGTFVAMDSGRLISTLNANLVPAFDSSGADRFFLWYRDGVGGWTNTAGQQTWPTDIYDDGSGTPAALNNNRYGNHWWYISSEDVHLVLGRNNDNNLSVTLDTPPPNDLPAAFANLTVLSSRWIIQQGQASPVEVESAWDGTPGGAGGVTEHSSLTGRSNADQHPISAITDLQASLTVPLQAAIGDGTSVLSTGVAEYLTVPSACTISEWVMVANPSGSAVIDVWKVNDAKPTIANTITASAKPTLTASDYLRSSTLTGWTTAVAANDVIAFNVDSATTITRLTISLSCTR